MRQPARPDLWEARVRQPPGPTRKVRDGQLDAALAGDLGVVSRERRNISAMIRVTNSGRSRWSVSGQATLGG
jgi:hypothetical protein